MKRMLITLLVLAPSLAHAQFPSGFDPAKLIQGFSDPAALQRMAVQAQEVQACMSRIDKAKLDGVMQEAKAGSAEIDRLCRAGKKGAAVATAMSLGKKMSVDPTFKQLKQCTEGMAEVLKTLPIAADLPDFDQDHAPTKDELCS